MVPKTDPHWKFQKSCPNNKKNDVFYTKSYNQGMQLFVFSKSDIPRGPRPVEMINFNKKQD